MVMANPFLESLGEPPKACMTKSSHPTANLKEKGNSDLPLLCLNYLSPILWLLVCVFTIWYFRPLAMQKEICQAHTQYPPHSTVSMEKTQCCWNSWQLNKFLVQPDYASLIHVIISTTYSHAQMCFSFSAFLELTMYNLEVNSYKTSAIWRGQGEGSKFAYG